MTYAVRYHPRKTIYFVMDRPDDHPNATIEEGAWIDIDPYLWAPPEGTPHPELVFCQVKDDPKHYKILRRVEDVDLERYDILDWSFGGTCSKEMWDRQTSLMRWWEDLDASVQEVMVESGD
jgi:hypothetical protein